MQHSAPVRQFIQQYFDDHELTVICYDYFRPVSDEFTDGMTRSTKIQLLLHHCDKYGHLSHLLTILEKQRPIPYAADLAPFITTTIAPPPPSITRPTRHPRQIFISYAHQEATIAQRLAHDLQQADWPIWIAPDSIAPGERWVAAIDRGLESSGIFLLLISPAAVNSRWVQDETYAAIDLEKKGQMRCRLEGFTGWEIEQAAIESYPFRDGIRDVLHFTQPQQVAAWQTLAQQEDNAAADDYMQSLAPPDMIYIPPGAFLMGSQEQSGQRL